MGSLIFTNMPGDNSRGGVRLFVAGLAEDACPLGEAFDPDDATEAGGADGLGFGKTPRIVMLPVVELTWLLTRLIDPWWGKPSSFWRPMRTGISPAPPYGTIFPSERAWRICSRVRS